MGMEAIVGFFNGPCLAISEVYSLAPQKTRGGASHPFGHEATGGYTSGLRLVVANRLYDLAFGICLRAESCDGAIQVVGFAVTVKVQSE